MSELRERLLRAAASWRRYPEGGPWRATALLEAALLEEAAAALLAAEPDGWSEALLVLRPTAHRHMTLRESYATLAQIFGEVGRAHVAISRSGRRVAGMSIDERVDSLLAAEPDTTGAGITFAATQNDDGTYTIRGGVQSSCNVAGCVICDSHQHGAPAIEPAREPPGVYEIERFHREVADALGLCPPEPAVAPVRKPDGWVAGADAGVIARGLSARVYGDRRLAGGDAAHAVYFDTPPAAPPQDSAPSDRMTGEQVVEVRQIIREEIQQPLEAWSTVGTEWGRLAARLADVLAPPPEPARCVVSPPTDAEVDSACLWFRHDFGLMPIREMNELRSTAREWLRAWLRVRDTEFAPPAAPVRDGALPPGPFEHCTDCGNRMIWSDTRRECPVWMCPSCTLRMREKAEARIAISKQLAMLIDSTTSLVAYRFATGPIPDDVRADLLHISDQVRPLYSRMEALRVLDLMAPAGPDPHAWIVEHVKALRVPEEE